MVPEPAHSMGDLSYAYWRRKMPNVLSSSRLFNFSNREKRNSTGCVSNALRVVSPGRSFIHRKPLAAERSVGLARTGIVEMRTLDRSILPLKYNVGCTIPPVLVGAPLANVARQVINAKRTNALHGFPRVPIEFPLKLLSGIMFFCAVCFR
jgi:hypothetical protein